MFRSKSFNKPENIKPMRVGGYGLWEIWYDDGPEGDHGARPVKSRGMDYIHHGASPLVFLYDDEAQEHATRLASHHPDKRFAIKLKRS